jgi:hypothetical protein
LVALLLERITIPCTHVTLSGFTRADTVNGYADIVGVVALEAYILVPLKFIICSPDHVCPTTVALEAVKLYPNHQISYNVVVA